MIASVQSTGIIVDSHAANGVAQRYDFCSHGVTPPVPTSIKKPIEDIQFRT